MKKLLIIVMLVTSVTAMPSWSHSPHGHNKHHQHRHHQHPSKPRQHWAKVTKVVPLYRRVAHRTPQRECWIEEVPKRQISHQHNPAGALVGGLIGAAIGHEVGHNVGNKAAGTVAGALVGGAIGHDLSHQRRQESITYQREKHCEVREQVHYEREVIGYRVTYRYHGDLYHTRLDHHPGKKIRVKVNAAAIHL